MVRTDEINNRQSDDFIYLKRISMIQDLTFGRLLDGSQKMLPEVAELCEDIGNLYLNIADEIHARLVAGVRDVDQGQAQANPNQRRVSDSILAAPRD